MGAFTDRIKGFLNIGKGRLQQGLARDTGDRRHDVSGVGSENLGRSQKSVGEIKQTTGNVVSKLGRKIKKAG